MASFSDLQILPKELRNLVYEKISPKDLVAAIRSGQIQDLTLQQWYKIHGINFNAQDSYDQFLSDLKLAKTKFQTFEQFYELNDRDKDAIEYAKQKVKENTIWQVPNYNLSEDELKEMFEEYYKKYWNRRYFDVQDVPGDELDAFFYQIDKQDIVFRKQFLREKYDLLKEQKISNVENFTLLHNLSPGFYLDTKGNPELKDITRFDVYFDIIQAKKLSFYDYYGKIDVILDDIKITLISDDENNDLHYFDWLKAHAKYFKCTGLSLDTRHISDGYVPFPYKLSERPVNLKRIRLSNDMALFEIFAGESENYYTRTRLRPLTEADMFYTEDKKQIRKLQGVEEITLRIFLDYEDEQLDVIGQNLILILKFNKIKKFVVEDFDAYPEEWWEMLLPLLEENGTTIEFNF